MDVKTYRGHIDPIAISVEETDGNVYILEPKNGDVGFAWGNAYEGAGPGQLTNATEEEAVKVRERFRARAAGINQTILAITTDLLDSEEAAVRVYQRLKHRTVLKWPSNQPWSITDAQMLREIEHIDTIERETEHIRRSHYARDVVMEGGAGVVWDTDIEGRRRGPR